MQPPSMHESKRPEVAFGVLTISDSCSSGSSVDLSGPTAVNLLQESGYCVALRDCVPDDVELIRSILLRWIASGLVQVIISTGGTGITRRDVTPDAFLKILSPQTRLAGLEHALYSASLKHTPNAALSRIIAGVLDEVLLITLPGSPKAIIQCVPVLLPVVEHAVSLIKGWTHSMDKNHVTPSASQTSPVSMSLPVAVDRLRVSPFPMISVEEAQMKIFQMAGTLQSTLGIQAVFHQNCLGRVLGLSLRARQCIPPFAASVMDGYALRVVDQTTRLHVLGALCAGDLPREHLRLTEGTCVRVSTGGPLPEGADAVVPVEHTQLVTKRSDPSKNINGSLEEEEDTIEVLVPPTSRGQFIRSVGCDLDSHYVFRRGLRLGPAEIGLLAGAGLLAPWPSSSYATLLADNEPECTIPSGLLDRLRTGGYLPCLSQPRIGLVSTGDEVTPFLDHFELHSVLDSNRPALNALLRKHGYPNVIDFGIVRDQIDSLYTLLNHAFSCCDILITTGGVSMGERDLVTHVLTEKFGATMHFSRIFMKPGKPTKFASVPICSNPSRSVLVFCLPGNPVSAFVTAHLFVLPLLRKLELRRQQDWCFPCIRVRLLNAVILGDRPDYRRAQLTWISESDTSSHSQLPSIPCALCDHLGGQSSSRLASCQDSNLLLLLPPANPACSELPVNSVVDALAITP
ncbi:unnamed protein product [Dicrocoelium dendriticum]|nr:unnamed protein product [Dicrocoelium dendriticum]